MSEDRLEHAREQAKAQYESIAAMVERLNHVRECSGEMDECEFNEEGSAPFYIDGMGFDEYHNEDDASEAIQEDPLSVEVRSAWTSPGDDFEASEFCILLCTGGPAVRIIGTLGDYNDPQSAQLDCQDWFTPWVQYFDGVDEQVLLAYAREFWYGE